MDAMSSSGSSKRTHDDMEAVVGGDEDVDKLPKSWILGCGDNEWGVLGQHLTGREQDDATGIRVVNPNLDAAAIRQLSCGGLMSAVLFETGEVFTFGSSDNGTLGRLFRGADMQRMSMWEWKRTPAPLDYSPWFGNGFGFAENFTILSRLNRDFGTDLVCTPSTPDLR